MQERLQRYHGIITDAWKILKSYCRESGDPDFKNQEYWDSLVHDQRKFIERYPDNNFAVEIMAAVICEIERISMQNDR